MNGLWADGWFYIYSAGLLVSGVLFFFLLGQYRAAADAADGAPVAAEPEAEHAAVRPVYIPDEPEPAPKLSSVASHEPPKPEPAVPAPAPVAAEPPAQAQQVKRENTTGGISPAVVYLQNIKTQLEGLHGQVADLTKRVESVTSRDEALIEKLGELAQSIQDLKVNAVPAEAPAKRVRKPAAAPEAVPPPPAETVPPPVAEEVPMKLELGPAPGAQVVKAPPPQPAAAPAPSPDATVRLEPGDIFTAAPEKKPEASDASAAEQPARRGPVWPV